MSQEIVIRGQIDAANSERALKFDLKNSFSISIAEEAMLQRFLNKWQDYVTPGEWTYEDLTNESFDFAVNEVKFAKDDPSTPYDETTHDGIIERLRKVGKKVFGQEFVDVILPITPSWDPDDFDRIIGDFLTQASDFIKKRVLTYMAYQNAMDADIRVLDGQIEGLIQEQKKAAESWAENEAADA